MIRNGHGGGAAGTRAPHPVRATQISEARRCLLQIPRENPRRRSSSPRPPSLFPARPQAEQTLLYRRPRDLSGDIPVLKGKRQLQEPCTSLQHPRQPRAAPQSATVVPGHPGHAPWVPFLPPHPSSTFPVACCAFRDLEVSLRMRLQLPVSFLAQRRQRSDTSGKPTNFCSGSSPGASSRQPRWPHAYNGEIEK